MYLTSLKNRIDFIDPSYIQLPENKLLEFVDNNVYLDLVFGLHYYYSKMLYS